ncbi:MAG TPA: hypothetical protein VIL17_00450 [Coriobacteriia bacterium]
MEKLERVLVAEDDAREALADAQVEAARLRAAAVEEARRIETDVAGSCDATIASERSAKLAAARAEAARIAQEATDRRTATLDEARSRLDGAVARITASLEA